MEKKIKKKKLIKTNPFLCEVSLLSKLKYTRIQGRRGEGGGGQVSPDLFQNLKKDALILGKMP